MIKIKENISLRQGSIMLFIILTGGIMALGGGGESGRDSWITPLIAVIVAIFLYYIYYKPFLICSNKNHFEIIDFSYGKFGKAINLFLSLNAFLMASISLSRFSIFIKTVALDKTPIYIISFFMIAVCIYGVYSGFEVLARFSEILIWSIVFFLAFSTIASFSTLNFQNLTPLFEDGIKPLIKGTHIIVATPFMETFFLIMLLGETKKRKDMTKTLSITAIISAIVMSTIFLRNLLILGYPVIESLYYPSYTAISLITLGDFFQRQEVLVSITFLIADILKICVYIIYASKSLNFVAKTREYKYYSIAISVAVLFFSLIIFQNTMELFNFLEIYRYLLTLPFIIVPILTLILCKYKTK